MINSFIKKNLEIILVVVVTAIICISGTVFATGYFASDVKYKKEDGTEISVEDALNDLYSIKSNGNIKSGTITSIEGDNSIPIGFIPKKVIMTEDNLGISFIYQSSFSNNKFIATSTTGNIEFASMNGNIDWTINITNKIMNTNESGKWSNYFVSIGDNIVFHIKNAGEIWHWIALKQ